MTSRRPSSETVATVALTVMSLVGGLAVACTAGVGTNVVRNTKAEAASPSPSAAPEPSPTQAALPPAPPANPRLRFPADAVVDVKAAYQAKGDGVTDDTAALQKAINENPGRTLFLPSGTYLVSRTLEARDKAGRWRAYLRLYGEQRDNTVIKLADGAPGFGNRRDPRAVLYTAADANTAGPRGDGDAGYGNVIENLTVDAGTNAGAIGIDYVGCNVAAIRRVTVTGRGVTGLALTRAWPGPALISRVEVRGFDHGIKVAQEQYGLTLEHITLSEQKVSGLDNVGNILAVRDLTSANAVPAVRNLDSQGLVTLVDARLTGGAAKVSAIDSVGQLMARRVTTSGYRSAVTQGGQLKPGADLAEYVSTPRLALFQNTPVRSTDLAVRETPEFTDPDPGHWVSVAAHGAKADDDADDSAAIQRALDSGKPVVYLPTGRYVVTQTLRVRGATRQIVGLNSQLTPSGPAFGDANAPTALFEIGDGQAPEVTVTGLTVAEPRQGGPASAGLIGFAHRTARPLVLKDVACCGEYKWSYRPDTGAGPLYLENVSASRWLFGASQQVWARQLNSDDPGTAPRVVNAGTLWILGFETEQRGPVLRSEGGARTEVLGGAVYEAGTSNDVVFECVDDASMTLSFATIGSARHYYRALVRQRHAGTGKELRRQQAVWRGHGRSVPLFAG